MLHPQRILSQVSVESWRLSKGLPRAIFMSHLVGRIMTMSLSRTSLAQNHITPLLAAAPGCVPTGGNTSDIQNLARLIQLSSTGLIRLSSIRSPSLQEKRIECIRTKPDAETNKLIVVSQPPEVSVEYTQRLLPKTVLTPIYSRSAALFLFSASFLRKEQRGFVWLSLLCCK